MAMDGINLKEGLKKHFGFDQFKGNQQEIIESILAGQDTFVLMPTGGGKSLCYQLPALLMPGTAVIISPLIALMKNQVDAVRGFCEEDTVAHFLNSSLSRTRLEEVKEDVRQGRTKLLYVAPESLHKKENIKLLQEIPISFYAVDEAHCISEWGHDFRPEYRRIRAIVTEIADRPIMALTATATPKVQHDIMKNLGMESAAVFQSSFNRPNLLYRIHPKTAESERDIVRYILSNPKKSGIVYCMRRTQVMNLTEVLQANGIKALPYHAGLDAKERDHRKLGKELDLFMISQEVGQGLPFWLPNGATIRRILERYIVDMEVADGYQHVYTPPIASV
ncbi:MAG: RecQ family ATP-dependent DNA helicase, partial [Porphyromonas pasteri]